MAAEVGVDDTDMFINPGRAPWVGLSSSAARLLATSTVSRRRNLRFFTTRGFTTGALSSTRLDMDTSTGDASGNTDPGSVGADTDNCRLRLPRSLPFPPPLSPEPLPSARRLSVAGVMPANRDTKELAEGGASDLARLTLVGGVGCVADSNGFAGFDCAANGLLLLVAAVDTAPNGLAAPDASPLACALVPPPNGLLAGVVAPNGLSLAVDGAPNGLLAAASGTAPKGLDAVALLAPKGAAAPAVPSLPPPSPPSLLLAARIAACVGDAHCVPGVIGVMGVEGEMELSVSMEASSRNGPSEPAAAKNPRGSVATSGLGVGRKRPSPGEGILPDPVRPALPASLRGAGALDWRPGGGMKVGGGTFTTPPDALPTCTIMTVMLSVLPRSTASAISRSALVVILLPCTVFSTSSLRMTSHKPGGVDTTRGATDRLVSTCGAHGSHAVATAATYRLTPAQSSHQGASD